MRRESWSRLSPNQQAIIARHAAKNGLPATREKFGVSDTAVRRACALNGVVPKRIHPASTKEARIATAHCLLRSLCLSVEDLLK